MSTFRLKRTLLALAFASGLPLGLGGCWGGSDGAPTPPATYSVGGSITGLTTAGLVLANGNDVVNLPAGTSSFVVSTALVSTTAYSVRVVTQPANATCTVTAASGTISNADGNVQVSCTTPSFGVGGSISGLATAGLVLSNGADTVSPAGGASIFTLPTPVASGTAYLITVSSQPAGATCSLTNASGTVDAAPVTNVAVTCAPNAYSIGGVVSGLTGAGLVLGNGTDRLTVPAGALNFAFPTVVASGGGYAVSVVTQPTGLSCSVANGTGTVGAAAVTSVQVTCGPLAFTVGGTITGLTGAGLVLANGGDTVRPAAGATSFVFPTPVAFAGSYSISVQTQPAGQTCTVAGTFPATMGSANVTNVLVSCTTTSTYTLVAGQEACPVQPIVDGTGAAASLNPQVKGAALDSAGNYYSFDGGRVRKVTPAGVVTTIAGGPPGNGTIVDGTGPAAVFGGSPYDTPEGLVVDASGNIILSDLNAIRKVTPSGVVTTIAGNAVSGNVDGNGTAARFSNPSGLAFDPAGNLLVLDGGNGAIRRIDALGIVTTLSRSGAGFVGGIIGTGSQLFVPSQGGLVADAAGTMYIAGPNYPLVSKVSPSGTVSTFAGSQTSGFVDGVGTAARFVGMAHNSAFLSFDSSGNLYVTDNLATAIRKITPGAVVSTPIVANNTLVYPPGTTLPPGALVVAATTFLGRALVTPGGNFYVYVGCSLQKTGP